MASCHKCKFLFKRDTGYSNYTVEGTDLHCVLRLNPKLPEEPPDGLFENRYERGVHIYKWGLPSAWDRWHATQDARCAVYEATNAMPICIDCDGDDILEPKVAAQQLLETADPMPLLIAQYFNKEV